MTSDKQNQKVGEGSLAVQAKGDATVNVGISTDEMRAIVECMAEQLPKYAAIASAIVEERLQTFEERVVGKFEDELKEHRTAFKDPDFQYLLRSAQHTFARSGDDKTCDNLVNLIGERAKQQERSLLSLSLNTAVERAGVLSRQEFACLSYSFLMRRVRHRRLLTVPEAATFLSKFLEPLFVDMPRSTTSYSYLESIGCGKISLGSAGWRDALINTYPHLFGGEVSLDQIAGQMAGDRSFGQSLIDAGFLIMQPSGNYMMTNVSHEEFVEVMPRAGFDQDKAESVWPLIAQGAPAAADLAAMLQANGFQAVKHFELVDSTALKHFEVTAVGIAIGHANLKRLANFEGDLAMWLT